MRNRGREANLIPKEGTAHRPLIRMVDRLPAMYAFTISDLQALTGIKKPVIRAVFNRLTVMRHIRRVGLRKEAQLWRKSRREWITADDSIGAYELYVKIFPTSARLASHNRLKEAIEVDV